MKKSTILVATFFFSLQFAYGQKIDTSVNHSPKNLHDFYMQKRKTNLIAGWTMFGSGIAMIIGGFAINVSAPWTAEHKNDGLWLSYLGGGVTLLSIPVLISAGINHKKAKLALRNESVFINTIRQSKYTSLSLSIPL